MRDGEGNTMTKRDATLVTAKEMYDAMEAAYIAGVEAALWVEKIPAWTDDEARMAFKMYMENVEADRRGKSKN